ncbi:hypothetical protein LJK88_46655 [Paenibacillus sp. P26]|nr:hypothetical protein LJK88_46655 [Paenibacillus sp. P26]
MWTVRGKRCVCPTGLWPYFRPVVKKTSLLLTYKTDDNQAVTLELVGNAVKEELVKLAEAYVGE